MVSGADWIPYCGQAPLPGDWLGRWNLDPLLMLFLIGGILFWRRLVGPALFEQRGFWTAVALLVLLFVSPFCALSSALFSARVAHHVLLTVAVAPLLAFSLGSGVPRSLGSLSFWTAVQALIFWAWHLPAAYAAALSNDFTYWAMQASLLASAFAFWSAIQRASQPASVACLLVSMVQMGLLGALVTFAAAPLYTPHFETTGPWGLAPLEDQQLGGLIMWVPSAGVYLGSTLVIAHRWLADEDRVTAQ